MGKKMRYLDEIKDEDFILLDTKLYDLIENFCVEGDSRSLNDDDATFGRYCRLRNMIIGFIGNTNRKRLAERDSHE